MVADGRRAFGTWLLFALASCGHRQPKSVAVDACTQPLANYCERGYCENQSQTLATFRGDATKTVVETACGEGVRVTVTGMERVDYVFERTGTLVGVVHFSDTPPPCGPIHYGNTATCATQR